jgi:hypothetical protein
MAIGVAVANAILVVTFAERSRLEGREPWEAAIEGARSRLRPILMTSFAMLAGMVPMALGLGEGGEQTAPLAGGDWRPPRRNVRHSHHPAGDLGDAPVTACSGCRVARS